MPPYDVVNLLEFLVGTLVMAAPIILVIWLVTGVLGLFRPDAGRSDYLESRAWDQERHIGRLEQEIADLRRRVNELERQQHRAGIDPVATRTPASPPDVYG